MKTKAIKAWVFVNKNSPSIDPTWIVRSGVKARKWLKAQQQYGEHLNTVLVRVEIRPLTKGKVKHGK